MKKYFPFFRKYRKVLILAPLLVIIDVVCEIVQPELMSKIVDQGVRLKSLHYIFQTGGIMLLLSIIAIAANIGSIYYSSHASVGFAAELRKGLFNKIQQFSFSNLDRFSSASLVTRLTNDVNILQDVIMMALRLLIRAPLMLLFAVIIAVRINAALASVIAIAIPVLSVSIYFILQRGLPFFVSMQQKLDKVNAAIQENLVNVRVVKSFVREDFEEKKFGCANDDLQGNGGKSFRHGGTDYAGDATGDEYFNCSNYLVWWQQDYCRQFPGWSAHVIHYLHHPDTDVPDDAFHDHYDFFEGRSLFGTHTGSTEYRSGHY